MAGQRVGGGELAAGVLDRDVHAVGEVVVEILRTHEGHCETSSRRFVHSTTHDPTDLHATMDDVPVCPIGDAARESSGKARSPTTAGCPEAGPIGGAHEPVVVSVQLSQRVERGVVRCQGLEVCT